MSFPAYKTVSGVNGPLVILDDVKVKITCTVSNVTDDRCYSSIFVKDIHAFSKHLYIHDMYELVIDILKMMKKFFYEIFYLVHVVDTCIDEILMIGLKAFMLLKSTCVLLFFSFQNLLRLSS